MCFKHGENTETGIFRKKPKFKRDYNLFAGESIEDYTSTLKIVKGLKYRLCLKYWLNPH